MKPCRGIATERARLRSRVQYSLFIPGHLCVAAEFDTGCALRHPGRTPRRKFSSRAPAFDAPVRTFAKVELVRRREALAELARLRGQSQNTDEQREHPWKAAIEVVRKLCKSMHEVCDCTTEPPAWRAKVQQANAPPDLRTPKRLCAGTCLVNSSGGA